jgi:hypothetical protein
VFHAVLAIRPVVPEVKGGALIPAGIAYDAGALFEVVFFHFGH